MERSTGTDAEGAAEAVAADVPLSFEAFFATERDHLFQALVMITGSRSEAEDISQEAFLRVWERWHHISTLDRPAGYLHRTAMNAFRDRYRRSRLSLTRAMRSVAEPPRDDFDAVEARSVTRQALAGLSSRQRAALVLTEGLGYSADEAGEFLGIKGSTVRSLRQQARSSFETSQERHDV